MHWKREWLYGIVRQYFAKSPLCMVQMYLRYERNRGSLTGAWIVTTKRSVLFRLGSITSSGNLLNKFSWFGVAVREHDFHSLIYFVFGACKWRCVITVYLYDLCTNIRKGCHSHTCGGQRRMWGKCFVTLSYSFETEAPPKFLKFKWMVTRKFWWCLPETQHWSFRRIPGHTHIAMWVLGSKFIFSCILGSYLLRYLFSPLIILLCVK